MAKTVLIIDDSPYSRSTVRRIVEDAGLNVVGEAKNGEEALDQIVTLQPNLITLDNILPDMTGIQVLKALNDQSIKHTIIMISAVGQRSVIEEALLLGAVAYLIKPFTADQLTEQIKKVFNSK